MAWFLRCFGLGLDLFIFRLTIVLLSFFLHHYLLLLLPPPSPSIFFFSFPAVGSGLYWSSKLLIQRHSLQYSTNTAKVSWFEVRYCAISGHFHSFVGMISLKVSLYGRKFGHSWITCCTVSSPPHSHVLSFINPSDFSLAFPCPTRTCVLQWSGKTQFASSLVSMFLKNANVVRPLSDVSHLFCHIWTILYFTCALGLSSFLFIIISPSISVSFPVLTSYIALLLIGGQLGRQIQHTMIPIMLYDVFL